MSLSKTPYPLLSARSTQEERKKGSNITEKLLTETYSINTNKYFEGKILNFFLMHVFYHLFWLRNKKNNV